MERVAQQPLRRGKQSRRDVPPLPRQFLGGQPRLAGQCQCCICSSSRFVWMVRVHMVFAIDLNLGCPDRQPDATQPPSRRRFRFRRQAHSRPFPHATGMAHRPSARSHTSLRPAAGSICPSPSFIRLLPYILRTGSLRLVDIHSTAPPLQRERG
jgi:hypothetical protein